MRNVALPAVIGFLVAAGSLVAAPVAKADIDFYRRPGCWGAIATSHRRRSDPAQLSDSTPGGGRGRLVVRRRWQDERLPGGHFGIGLSFDRGRQRRENVSGASRAHPGRG
jgi:hypothetical protein